MSGDLYAGWLSRYPENTAAAYRRDLADYITTAGDPLTATRADVQEWLRVLARRGLKPPTIRRKASALSSFLEYAAQEGAVEVNAARHTRRPLGGDAVKLGLSLPDARRLLDTAAEHSPRAAALIGLLMAMGLRVSEACGARVEHLTTDAGAPVLELVRKGGRTHRLPVPPAVHRALIAATGDRPIGPILTGPRGGHLTRHAAAELVAHLGEKAGIPHLTPHLLRHTAATTALRAGVPLERVQQLLGHRSPTTTLRYAQALEALDHSASDRLASELYQ